MTCWACLGADALYANYVYALCQLCERTQNNSRQPRECARVCVFYLRTESPDTIPVQLFRASALASWPHWHNLSALSGLSARLALAIKYASEYNKLLKCLSLSAQQIRSRFQWIHRTTNCTANQIRAEKSKVKQGWKLKAKQWSKELTKSYFNPTTLHFVLRSGELQLPIRQCQHFSDPISSCLSVVSA